MSHNDERRRLPRRRTRLSAAAVHGPEATVVACTVRDRSGTGARLLVDAGSSLPDVFHLIELSTGELHRAQVVWRDTSFVGVTFLESERLDAPQTPEQIKFADIRTRLTSKAGAR
jgi:hypothetical protein